jgi:Ti-type conjugative transfer relaxase TraA
MRDGKDTDTPDDYYSKEGHGNWHGAGAEALGLTGEVSAQDFAELSLGFHPRNGAALVQNAGSEDRRAGWDLTFSAPKSASICWAVGDAATRQGIEAAHAEAVKIALDLLQEKAGFVRVGQDGREREAAELVFATFQHGTSRELDPQIHTHSFVFNQGLRSNGQWASLDSKGFFDWKMAAGACYRAALAERLRDMGYTIERDGDSFRIAGVGKPLEEHFSQRRAQIVEHLKEHGYTSAAAAAAAALDTRQAKNEIELEKLTREWETRAGAFGFERQHAMPGPGRGDRLAMPSAPEIMDEVTKMDVLVKEQQIYAAAFREAQGAVDVAEARRIAEQAIQGAVRFETERGRGTRYSTHELVRQEREIAESATARKGETAHQLSEGAVSKALDDVEASRGFALNAEQRAAVHHLTRESGGVAVMVGDAGTGKSTTLAAVREAYQGQGYTVIGCALAGKAAAGLEESSGISSRTIDALQRELDNGTLHLDRKTVLVVDEAGMVDSRKMHALMSRANEVGAKVILVGDHKQLQPVAAGATFRHVAERAGHCRLEDIHRQREDWHKDAVREMSRGEAAKSLLHYIERGQVKVQSTHRAACTQAVKIHEANVKEVGHEKALIIAGTNAQVRDLNTLARARMIERGELGESQPVKLAENKKIYLAAGDRIQITRNHRDTGLRNGDLATVTRIADGRLQLQIDRSSRSIEVDPTKLHLRHGYATTTHKAQGATVERAVVLGSANTSREMAYVQVSRAKEKTDLVFTVHQVKQMAEKTPPSEKVLHAVRLDQKPALDPKLEQLRDVVAAMSRSHQKETTLDHTPHVPPPGGPASPARDRETGLDLEL